MSDNDTPTDNYLRVVSHDGKFAEDSRPVDTTSELVSLINLIKKDLKKLNNETRVNQEEFQEEVRFQLDSASNKLAARAYESFAEKTLKDSNEAIKSLKDMSFKASTQIAEATKKTKFNFKKLSAFIIAGSVVGGLIGGVVGGSVMRYFPKLDDYVEERYTWGRALERSWKDLSKAEQNKIQKLLTKNTGSF